MSVEMVQKKKEVQTYVEAVQKLYEPVQISGKAVQMSVEVVQIERQLVQILIVVRKRVKSFVLLADSYDR